MTNVFMHGNYSPDISNVAFPAHFSENSGGEGEFL